MQVEPRFPELFEITPDQVELLRVAGFSRPSDLLKQTPDRLSQELENAKEFLNLESDLPSKEQLGEWLERCRAVTDAALYRKQAPDLKSERPLDGSPAKEEVPEAIYLDKNQLRLLKVGPARFPRATEQRDQQAPVQAKRKLTDVGEVNQPKINAERVKRMEDYAKEGSNIAPLERGEQQVRTTPKASTNRGKNEKSRLYIRGVLHPSGRRVRLAAINTLFFYALFPLSIAAVVALLTLPKEYDQWRLYLLIVPVLLIISAILFVSVSYRSKCCVCAQRLFVPKNCNKNKKAHRLIGLGYVLPLAIHIALFKWFRCTFCGTSIRTKE